MNKFYPKQSKATLCSYNSCVTVQGKAARTIEVIAVSTVLIWAITKIAKLLK